MKIIVCLFSSGHGSRYRKSHCDEYAKKDISRRTAGTAREATGGNCMFGMGILGAWEPHEKLLLTKDILRSCHVYLRSSD